MTKLSRSSYPQSKIDEALLAYYVTGTFSKAQQETGVPMGTISRWVRKEHQDRYMELAERHAPEIEAQLRHNLARTAARAAETTDLGLEATNHAIHNGDAKAAQSLSTAARNAATVLGITTDKKLLLEGRPTEIHGRLDANEALKSLAQMAGITLEGTATEMNSAGSELPDPTTS